LKGALQKASDHPEARYLLGVTYLDLSDFQAAETELRRAIDLGYERAKVDLGKSLLGMGRYQNALDEVPLSASAAASVQAEVLTVHARALLGLGRNQEGRELLDQALVKQPEFSEALIVQARLAARDESMEAASQLIERALVSSPRSLDGWMMKGFLARSRGDQPSALTAYQKVIEISPEVLHARVSLAEIYIDARNFDVAQKQLQQVRKVAPNHTQAGYLLALIEFRQKRLPAAREAVLQVLKGAPNHYPSVLLAGAIELSLGSHEQAQKHLLRVVERAPAFLYGRTLLVSSLMSSGQVQRAIEVLRPGLEQAPDDSALAALAGEVYLHGNDFSRAAHYFEKAVKLDPKSVDGHTGLGRSRIAMGDTERALANLETAVQLDSDKYRAEFLLVALHYQRGDFDRALQAMQSLEKKQPNNPWTYNLKGMIYNSKGDETGARNSLERALEIKPDYVPAAINLAQLDLRQKKTADARRRLEAILAKDSSNAEALTALATLGPRIGATSKEQVDWLERARKASPESIQPQLMLARTYAQTGDLKKALEVVQKIDLARPNNSEVLDALGGFQVLAGAKEQALSTFNKLAALQPKSATVLLRLAMAQAANGDQTRAVETLRKAISIQPDYIDAHVALANFDASAGRYPAAIKIAQHVQKRAPTSPTGFVLEGDILMAEKKFQQAVKAYEAAYGVARTGSILSKIHAALTRAGRSGEAETRLAQAVKESPDDSVIRIVVAEMSLNGNRYPIAVEHYEWLLRKHPENVMFLNNLAMAYHHVKDIRALETAERAHKLQPDNAAIADTLGWILVEQGNPKRGLELLQRAVAAAPKNPEIRYHLAQALVKIGDHTRARQELGKLLAEMPSSSHAKDAKQLLTSLGQ